ncbi:MAG: hypothetical protein JXM72_04700 [Deltaproteobacteria bacterium]|nr:hypothetical protein [Deltaproteobacteria bacterium]
MKTKNNALGIIVISISCILFMQCSSSSTSPLETVGLWTTINEDYAGETIEFTPETITMSSASQRVLEYTIDKVTSEKGPVSDSTLYTFHYTDKAGNRNLFNLIYTSEDGGTLMFKSEQDILWKRM